MTTDIDEAVKKSESFDEDQVWICIWLREL